MAKKKKIESNKELKLEDVLFNCRNQLRGKASMADKRDLLLTLVFLRFVGERFNNQKNIIRHDLFEQGRDPFKDADFIQRKLNYPPAYLKAGVFYLKENARWESIVALNADAELASKLDTIINELEQDNNNLTGALPQKIFTNTNLDPQDLKAIIDEVGKISQEKYPERDLIGHVYEYFLQAFAFQVKDSKEEGEFYTPFSIVDLIANIVEPLDGTIYDPCCGSGGMFVQSMKVIEAHGGNKRQVSVYGQEINKETFRLAKMNLAVRGISHNLGTTNASTFLNDMHQDKKMDYVITNPPFNKKAWRGEDQLLHDPRWAGYGLPPTSNANYAWILHILNKLKKNTGIAGFLLANGALNDEDTIKIRQKLIENDKVEAIFVLPRNMFYNTDISVTLWVINQNKRGGMWHGRKQRNRTGEILFADLRTWNENVYEKKYVQFLPEQIKQIVNIYHTWQAEGTDGSCYAVPELYRSVSREEVQRNAWSLVPSRYIEFVDRDRDLDYDTILTEAAGKMKELAERLVKNQEALCNAFKSLGYGE